MVTLPINLAQTAGFPSQWSDSIAAVAEGLIVGETPAVVIQDMVMAAGQTILAYTAVGYDGSDNLVPAISGTTQAIGITLFDIVTLASPVQGVPILVQGCLNKDMITWPASYNTDEKKFEAFRGAPTPTSIVVRKVYLGATVAQP